jgi:hypothetical protein
MSKNKFVKIGAVIAGYIIALIGAFMALYIRMLTTQGTDAQASAGMYAFGDAIVFLVVFGIMALIPTVLAFYFLRSIENFWNGFAVICLAFSITGLVVVIANALIDANGGYGSNSFGLLLSLIGILGIFGAPLFVVCFVLLAIITPSVRSRLFLLISAGCELLAGLYVLVNFLLFKRFF